MPRIVVLDGYTTSPLPADAAASDAQVSWQPLNQLGELIAHEPVHWTRWSNASAMPRSH